VYQFFHPPENHISTDKREYQFFKCNAPRGCKLPGGGVRRYQTNSDKAPAKDRSSTSTLSKHAKKCWGGAVVMARMKGVDAQPKDGSIHAAFARRDERPAVASDRTLTPAELRAHIVRWVAESNRPLVIVEDREFKTIIGAGRPEFGLPGRRTVSRDLNVSFAVSRAFVEELLKEYTGRLSFATDAWTSPNHRAFVAWTVHLHHEGRLLSFPLDIFEVPEVRNVSSFYQTSPLTTGFSPTPERLLHASLTICCRDLTSEVGYALCFHSKPKLIILGRFSGGQATMRPRMTRRTRHLATILTTTSTRSTASAALPIRSISPFPPSCGHSHPRRKRRKRKGREV
ncbi:hypothetical protein GGX14DRAFT_360542, partial [Mycena pura]